MSDRKSPILSPFRVFPVIPPGRNIPIFPGDVPVPGIVPGILRPNIIAKATWVAIAGAASTSIGAAPDPVTANWLAVQPIVQGLDFTATPDPLSLPWIVNPPDLAGTALTEGLISFWNLNEITGATRADAFGSNDLEDANTSQVDGKIDKAAFFNEDGASNPLSIPDNPSLSTGDINFSFSCWVFIELKTDFITFAGKYFGGTLEWRIFYNSVTDRFCFSVSTDGTEDELAVVEADSFGSPPLNTWTHIVVGHNSVTDTIDIQINNGTIDTTPHSGGVFDGTSQFRIGDGFEGRVDAVGFWKKVLSPGNRLTLFNNGAGTEHPFTGIRGNLTPDPITLDWNVPLLSQLVEPAPAVSIWDTPPPSVIVQLVAPNPFTMTWDVQVPIIENINLLNGIVAFWKMEEAIGTTRTDSVGSNDLTDNNDVGAIAGQIGTASEFGIQGDEFLSIPDNADLSTGDIDFTWATWFFMDASFTQVLISKGDLAGTNLEYLLFHSSSEDIRFQVSTTGTGLDSNIAITGLTVGLGEWNFVVAWHDSVENTLNIQLNNGLVASTSHSGGLTDGDGAVLMGALDNGGPAFELEGNMDAVGFWKRVLNASERTKLYNNGGGVEHPFTDFAVPRTLEPDPVPPASWSVKDTTVFSDSILLTDLIAFWKLGEASGTRFDDEGSNDLTDNNTVLAVVGKVGNAAQFTAVNSESLSIADNTDLSAADEDFTISGWVFLDSKPGANMSIVSKDKATSPIRRSYQLLWVTATDRFRFQISDDDAGTNMPTVEANSFGAPSTGVFIYVTAWHDSVANTINIQVNNGPVDSTAATFGNHDEINPFTIGARGDGFLFWDGRIDAVGFWKRVLTSDERTELFNSGNGKEHPFT